MRRIIRDPDFPKKDIDRAINSVISSINSMGRFKFHQSSQLITLVASQKDYTLTNFIAEELVVFDIDSDDEKILLKPSDLVTPYSKGWFSETGDEPSYYLIWGGKMWFDPIPNATAALKKVTVLGFFRVPMLTDDLAVIGMNDHYCVSVLAWGAAAEINPTMIVESGGKQANISSVYMSNLVNMRKTELWEPMASPGIIRDTRWSGLGDMGHVERVR